MDKRFYSKDAEDVAKALLGKIIVRKIGSRVIKARIVETEAYYDEKDPASRACQNGSLRETMLMEPGTILVYGVHNNWLVNIVTGRKGKAQAVLLRALEPLTHDLRCNGPGLLTKALEIDKIYHNQNIIENKEILIMSDIDTKNFEIKSSKRIGIKKDLPRDLRFFIPCKFVSR